MKFSTQEEYGLRLLLRIGKSDSEKGMTIPELSEQEGLSEANVGKILLKAHEDNLAAISLLVPRMNFLLVMF
jgi:DNA-binding IscR family transcriptional regulator